MRNISALERWNGKFRVDADTGCWVWTAKIVRSGYGSFWNGVSQVGAHRFGYESLVGPVPEGLELDHLCRVRACVNPSHLEPVTHQENVIRGVSPAAIGATRTHCPQGHEYSPENTNVRRRRRECRICINVQAAQRMRRHRARKRAAAAA